MSKERLEEVDSWLLSMKETLFQAVKEGEKEEEIEEVQHLIDVYEWLREQAFAVHGGETFIGYKEQMNRYREVLEFYSKESNYSGYLTAGGWVKTPINDDNGETARQALKGELE